MRMGTVFESSHLPLHLWLQIIHLMCASKKGISTRQIQRMLVCSMKTAWFLGHRIREAMKDGGELLGGEGETVEADETFLSKSPKTRKTGPLHARSGATVVSLVQRGGPIRSIHLDDDSLGVQLTVERHLAEGSRLVTDGANHYKCHDSQSRIGGPFQVRVGARRCAYEYAGRIFQHLQARVGRNLSAHG